jgi:DNA-binding NarL/FixJ family response regulator
VTAGVLIVDDDIGFRRIAGVLLRRVGLKVAGEAADKAQARRECERLRPDAALIDVNLPDGYGTALADELTASMPELRVLLTSTDPSIAPRGGIPFVPKADLPTTDLAGLLA